MAAHPDREQFNAVLAEIFAGLDKPFTEIKREALWRGCQSMSTAQLGRVRDAFFADAAKGEVPRALGVREIWGKLRELRALATVIREEEPPWPGGPWEIRANCLLFAHIRRQASLGIHYCSEAERSLPPDPKTRQWRSKGWAPDAETLALTQPLIDAKRDWAELMRNWEGEPTAQEQQEFWKRALELADAKCKQLREGP